MPRAHGTHACYVWGPEPGCEPGRGCRCDACKQAHSDYEAQRKRRSAPAYVGADRARKHVQFLSDHGVGLKTVAARSGVSQGSLWKLVYGAPDRNGPSKRIRRETEQRILAVMPADRADGALVPAGPTWEIIDQLLERGWTKAAISRSIGQRGGALQVSRMFVTAAKARRVAALLDEPVPPRRSRHGLRPVPQPAPTPTTSAAMVDLPRPPAIGLAAQEWRRRAACRMPDVPEWLFFPGRGDTETTNWALEVCKRCPVRSDCLEAHLDEVEGIWGGTTGRDRRRIRRARGLRDREGVA